MFYYFLSCYWFISNQGIRPNSKIQSSVETKSISGEV